MSKYSSMINLYFFFKPVCAKYYVMSSYMLFYPK